MRSDTFLVVCLFLEIRCNSCGRIIDKLNYFDYSLLYNASYKYLITSHLYSIIRKSVGTVICELRNVSGIKSWFGACTCGIRILGIFVTIIRRINLAQKVSVKMNTLSRGVVSGHIKGS